MKNLPAIKPIFISLSPNTEKDDILLALKLILQPWKWTNDKKQAIVENPSSVLENKFKEYLEVKHAFAFNSGRAAFLAILNSLNLEKGSEVLLQAFTCNAVVNPICWTGFKPVFVDIDKKTLNLDPEDLERKIGSTSRVVMVQHTFGLPVDLDQIKEICQRHNLVLIEDCAHSLGARFDLKGSSRSNLVGTLGKAAFFSFGRDKIISSVFGGLAVTNDDNLAKKIREFRDGLAEPSYGWIFQQLLHPVLTNLLIIPLYRFWGTGKWVLLLFQKLKILSKAVSNKEKRGIMPKNFAKKMSEAIAILALNQFQKLEKFLNHQREIADFYDKNLADLAGLTLPRQNPGRIYLRYPVLINNKDTDKILGKARKAGIFLDDGWRKTPIVPPDTDQARMGYQAGKCPVAERVAQRILNLPTHVNISKEKAWRIVDFLNNYRGD